MGDRSGPYQKMGKTEKYDDKYYPVKFRKLHFLHKSSTRLQNKTKEKKG